MRIPRPGEQRDRTGFVGASDDAAHLILQARRLVEQAMGVGWYDTLGNDVDRAAFVLCRLRRAGAGAAGAIERGDEAVRAALSEASPEALVWLASRALSYMDERGYPESVERWFPETFTAGGEEA